MSLNSEFEKGVIDYVRSLVGLEGNVYPIKRLMLYRLGDMYFFGNGCNLFVGLRKESMTKTEHSLGMELFSYHDCKTMEHFKFVSSIRDDVQRRGIVRESGLYGFLNDGSIKGFLLWSGDSKTFFMKHLEELSYVISLWSHNVVFSIFGRLGLIYGGNYVVNVEELMYGGDMWIKVSSLWFVVYIRKKKFRMGDRLSFESYLSSLSRFDLEPHRKKDSVFRGLRVYA